MGNACIFVDNLRMGGFQRVALDQAYYLADSGYKVVIFVLEKLPIDEENSFLSQEQELLMSRQIEFRVMGFKWSSILASLIKSRSELSSAKLMLSHSLRSVVVLKLLRIFLKFDSRIFLIIHQVPRLTDIVQRLKRFVYSQFTDELYCFSRAVELDWFSQFSMIPSSLLSTISLPINTVRNGIYLPRLPDISVLSDSSERKRIYFLGRPAFWKGIDTIRALAATEYLKDYDFVFLVPRKNDTLFSPLEEVLGKRLIVMVGKTIKSITVRVGDVHLYPANYGRNVTVFESISLNCLEFAALGVPSLVTRGGLLTWPDFNIYDVFYEVDWNDIPSVASLVLSLSSKLIPPSELSLIRDRISIANQINQYLN